MAQMVGFMGAIMSAVGSVRQGNIAKNAADYNAQVDEQNAQVALNQGTQQQEIVRRRAQQAIGEQLASVSSSGTGLNGSNLDLLSESLYNKELDSLNIRYESELKARGLQSQAQLTRIEGKQARTAGYLSAAQSIGKAFGSSYLNAGGTLN